MSIFSKVKDALKKVTTKGGDASKSPSNVIKLSKEPSNVIKLGKDTSKLEKTMSSIAQKISGKTAKQIKERDVKVSDVAKRVAIPAAVVGFAAAAPAAAAAGAGAVAKMLIPKTVGQAAVTVVGAGVVAAGAAPTIAKGLFTAGTTTGEVILGEKQLTPETVKDVAKGAGILLGIGAVGSAAGYVASKVMKDDKDIPIPSIPAAIPTPQVSSEGVTAGVPITPTAPQTPETVFMEDKPVVAPSKTTQEGQGQKISQRVSIDVFNRNSANRITKNYINTHRHRKRHG